ncbi:hypothetical protein SZ47_10610 [Brachyspira hyodysenteriae]|uniref:Uncharacterized protein n=2 Tax=Brachyspira hyodysenteriae TaxID=159 RepID=A0A3B6VAL1_BRAHW|nr:DUF6338 family protein [Brachyspira hyodysenteriae]ACN83217.1 hypothetical protein BHWA1_00723 [Brachyspira hyodysenteriae WA1]ANN64672.1 hypothetical protein BHYOB78_12620 [Brachyspira hyodysenteriae ATCC 27164]KLI23464.1 hypothetical protein SZ47_10610 [Brachyspira hyodysenteriae]KLI26966.1 hypothetical protein SR30_04395 [Brachyspira hyodysenteriae]KLI33663.1 hypothetical protein SZ50_06775 [Brachyspira hyodysenteriae]
MDFSSLITVIIFILPGFIIITVKNLYSYVKKINTFSKILQSLIATICIWYIIIILSNYNSNLNNIFNILLKLEKTNFLEYKFQIFTFFIIVYLVSFILGLVIGYLLHRLKFIEKLYNKIYYKIFSKKPTKHIFEHIFYEASLDKNKNIYVFIKTISGEYIFGFVKEASDNIDDRSICIYDVHQIRNKQLIETLYKENNFIYIKENSIEYIYILNDISDLEKICNYLINK